jgi:hypothetical protein
MAVVRMSRSRSRLRAAMEEVQQRARAGEALPQSFGIPGARARLPRSLASDHQELRYQNGRVEAMARWQEPPRHRGAGSLR